MSRDGKRGPSPNAGAGRDAVNDLDWTAGVRPVNANEEQRKEAA